MDKSIDDIPNEMLSNTIIGLEYQRATLSRWQWKNNWTIGSWIAAAIIVISILTPLIPQFFQPDIIAWGNALIWFGLSFLYMIIEQKQKLIDIDATQEKATVVPDHIPEYQPKENQLTDTNSVNTPKSITKDTSNLFTTWIHSTKPTSRKIPN